MAKLTSKTRNKLPASEFGMPRERKYPMGRCEAAREARSSLMKPRIYSDRRRWLVGLPGGGWPHGTFAAKDWGEALAIVEMWYFYKSFNHHAT